MSAIVTLSKQLRYYKRLQLHRNRDVSHYLTAVQHWQKQRMQRMHQPLFSQLQYQRLASFLLDRLYNMHDLNELAKQLDKALKEKIKLDRFLPEGVLSAAISAFRLAYLTLKLDEQIAQHLLDQGITIIDDDSIHQAMLTLQQYNDRIKQLILLRKISQAFHQYGRSFLTQSAFRLARRTAYRREFNFLYDYLAEAFAAIRSTDRSNIFFEQFIADEKQVLQRIYQGHPMPFGQNCQLAQA